MLHVCHDFRIWCVGKIDGCIVHDATKAGGYSLFLPQRFSQRISVKNTPTLLNDDQMNSTGADDSFLSYVTFTVTVLVLSTNTWGMRIVWRKNCMTTGDLPLTFSYWVSFVQKLVRKEISCSGLDIIMYSDFLILFYYFSSFLNHLCVWFFKYSLEKDI